METTEKIVEFDLSAIDRAIAISLGWRQETFMEKMQIDEYFKTLLEQLYERPSMLILEEEVSHFSPPDSQIDSALRWVGNEGIPHFSTNGEDLKVLLSAINQQSLYLETRCWRENTVCTLEDRFTGKFIVFPVATQNINLAICLAWLKFYDIKI